MTEGDATVTFHVDSEVGRLRQVILHKPGLELSRLTPTNVEELLFDDVLWAKRAREEHDAFAAALRDHDVTVHYFDVLLAETVANSTHANGCSIACSTPTPSARRWSSRCAAWPRRSMPNGSPSCSSAAC